ncbi:MAG: sulfur carrier protein ThiS [Planctomycetes bacterium]|nr:sulfur carrier protein ThiS [Planctomycetota bacterium]
MQITVNSQPREVPEGTTLARLVEDLGLRRDRIAAERNLKVVPKAQYEATALREGDRLEIVTFVGGG